MNDDGEDETGSHATLTSIHAGESIGSFSAEGYEPWLFQTMLNELSERELGVGFIYSILELFATRHELTDVAVVLVNESFGTQMFRLGGESVTAEMAAHLTASPGVYCEPDTVPSAECDAVRTACQLAMSLHLARFSAAHDPLTNIANRRSFDEALEVAAARSARYGWAFTLVLVDLNNFKAVNDKSGHEFGNHLLRQFGFALRQAVRQGDTAARIGGDEFAVILSNAEGHESSGFTERLKGHLVALGNPVEFTIGTATSPRDSTDPGELLRMADGRLYEKKGIRIMMSRTEEDFELELRSLPGVLNVGITKHANGDVNVVTLVANSKDPLATRSAATQIASLYYPEAAVVVEDANRALIDLQRGEGPRVALIRADYDTSDGFCEVQLSVDGRTGIGRAGSGPLIGGAEATLSALRDLGYDVPYSLMTVTNVTNGRDWPVIVTLRSLANDADRFGIARSEDDLVSAVKATLDSLNRFLSALESRD